MSVVMKKEEVDLLNVATNMVAYAKANLINIWSPIREKYGLEEGVEYQYNRENGEIADEEVKQDA